MNSSPSPCRGCNQRSVLLVVVLVVLMASAVSASQNPVYIAQNAVGNNNGQDCADAYAVTYFNASRNWGTGSTQIGPGTVVHLCGTITSSLSFQGSGTSGNVIELLFESGANLTSPVFSVAINLNGNSYLLIDGGTACGVTNGLVTACSTNQAGTGIIQNTQNGSSLANQTPSGFINDNSCGHDIEIRNLLLLNAYVKGLGTTEDSGAADVSDDIYLSGCGNNINVHDLTATYAHANITIVANGSPSNWIVANSVTAHGTWGVALPTGSGNPTNLFIHDNDINMGQEWSQSDGTYHIDGIFVYGQSQSSYPSGVYIYNNYLHGDWVYAGSGQCPTGFAYTNQDIKDMYIFNNIFQVTSSGGTCNGMSSTGYGNTKQFLYNNDFVGFGTTAGGVAMGDAAANGKASTTLENNIVYNANGAIYYSHSGAGGFVTVDHNLYDTVGTYYGTGPWNDGTTYSTFSAWQGGGFDTNGSNGSSKLASSYPFTLQSGSAAIGLGANLYSVCNGQPNPGLGALCFDKSGAARPSSGNWDAGAYMYGSSQPPNPPTGLAAVVN